MKQTVKSLDEMLGPIPDSLQKETELSFQISDRIFELMQERGLSNKQFADALGKRPCEVYNPQNEMLLKKKTRRSVLKNETSRFLLFGVILTAFEQC